MLPAPNSPASLFIQAFFPQLHKLRLPFFLPGGGAGGGGGGGGGGRATALSKKQPCFRARSHESGYF